MSMNEREDGACATMHALIQRSRQGPTDLILVTDRLRPAPGPGEYLIRVGAAGVNFADVMQTWGRYGDGPRAPYVAGFEAAGEIVAVSPDVDDPLPLGVHVVGTGAGAFAQYMVMPASSAVPVPSGWSDAASMGLILNWVTAVAALRLRGEVVADDVVLVHAAAGGVGQAAIRLAHHYGAHVIATASPAKHEDVRALGVDDVLDSRRPDLATAIMRLAGPVDLVLESVGQATFETSLSVLKRFTGRIVVFGAASGDATISTHDLVFRHQVQIKGLHIGALAEAAPALYRSVLAEIDSLIADGVYAPGFPQLHALADGPHVLQHLDSGNSIGKHALDPWR